MTLPTTDPIRPGVGSLRDRTDLDVLVVGGGINGIATLRDLALQGVGVALVERGDLVSGASSSSSHMVLGWSAVRVEDEVLRAAGILRRNHRVELADADIAAV